ncbi:hypothetical protein SZ64_00785 [Erythrobacter sp. SG61-1L]|uniref:ATP-binding protein n=1 Tax=Erythrobacter sp. SG61-1L TaxID=1603897 RepID=UPI0006D6A406|nr:ATP-binding protein [Erythrobacter sp. SG61-1L]KPL66764.1 hypothetical protein SZ64_00785 [Erythrobacter sp. SG61-1L]
MKRRLFWKILLAFWLTLFAITQGVWLLFELNRNDRPNPQRLMEEEVAPAILAAGAQAVTTGGPAALSSFTQSLPDNQRGRVELSNPADPVRPKSGDDLQRVVSRMVNGPDGTEYRLTYTYQGMPARRSLPSAPPEMLILGLFGGLAFSAALAWYLTEPINRLRKGFDRLARGDLEVRLAASIGRRRDEIADLGRDFDLMAQRLEMLVSARDRLLHDVSHELRTPLARMQLAIALARKDAGKTEQTLQRIEQEAQRLEMLVGELLTLARAEHGQRSQEDYFDLAGVLESVLEDARFEAEASRIGIRLQADIPDEDDRPLVRGSAELVRRAIDNIMRNALRFSKAGQDIDVFIGLDPQAGLYRVEISDAGPGVPDADIAAMFNPFVRGEDGGAGLGLGLSIASRAVMAHGGTVEARNRVGGGFTVAMAFPVD